MKSKWIKLILLPVAAAIILISISYFQKRKSSMDWVFDYELKEGTQGMVEIMAAINQWVDHEDAKRLEPSLLRKFANLFYKSQSVKTNEAISYLQLGQNAKAIEILQGLSRLDWDKNSANAKSMKKINKWLAISYLRYGEEQNCILNHDGNSCLMPMQGTGIYKFQEPTLKAIEIFSALLTKDPDNYRYKWLLNVAYQTLGTYPQEVPTAWLISPGQFKDTDPSDNFVNIAPMLGVDHNSLAGGACMEDFNNDGYLDILTSGRKRTQLTLYLNNGMGGFDDKTEQAGLMGLTGGFNLFKADYNNDGFMDVFVVRGAWMHNSGLTPNSLLKNNGDGTFSDVTVTSGLLSFKPTLNAVWADFNNDGWVDLFVGNETRGDKGSYSSEFYLNNRDGTFREVSNEVGLGFSSFVKGVAAEDYDNDGWVDLYISNKSEANFLFHNEGLGADGQISFKDMAAKAGVADPKFGFTSWFWDYNNDGLKDLYVSVYSREGSSVEKVAKSYDGQKVDSIWPSIFENNGDGTFTNRTEDLKMDIPLFAMGANYADFNNDGFLDFYLGTGEPSYEGIYPNRMFYSHEGKFFEDVTSEKGVGHIQKGHGVAIGDIDNDGDQDIYAQMGGMQYGDSFQNALFQNPGTDYKWITLKLEGVESNRGAIGSQVKLTVNTATGVRIIYRTVSSGGSFGANSLQLEIGLGDAISIDSLQVNWQGSGLVQTFLNVPLKTTFKVKEGEEKLIPFSKPPIIFASILMDESSHSNH
jgi:tetratricopeptide (TPR) repeat protein